MKGSIVGPTQIGLSQSFRPAIMVGDGAPDNVVLAPSGTILRDLTNDALYMNDSGGVGAGSEWRTYT